MASIESSRRPSDEIEDLYPLSPAQAGMFFHCLNTPWQGMYGQQFVCTIRGALRADAFERAWRDTIDRHPALRSAFVWEGLAQPLQAVVRAPEIPWTTEDWRAEDRDGQTRTWDALLRADRSIGYALERAPLMRFHLARCEDDEHWFLWNHHHLLLDGWSVSIVLADVVRTYVDTVFGLTRAVAQVPAYREYIGWLDRSRRKDAETYWRRTLAGFREPTPLPASAPAIMAPAGAVTELYAEERLKIDEATSLELQRWCARERITLNTLALGTWALLLSRHARQDDVVCGVTVSGRPPELSGVDSMVGLFINTLPARIRVPRRESVQAWLDALQCAQAEAREYDHTPLVEVQGQSDLPRRVALFETVFVCENYPPPAAREVAGLRIEHADAFEPTHYALTVTVKPGREIGLQIGYDRQRFDASTVKRLLEQYMRLIVALPADSARALGRVSLLDEDEREQRIVTWNKTAQSVGDAWLDERVTARARIDPDMAAVEDNGQQASYAELDAQSNRLARRLQDMGVGRDVVVAVCLEPSTALVMALLAVVKSGGAYLPLDPDDPAPRLASLIEDSHAAVVITHDACIDRLPHVWIPVLDIDADADLVAQEEPTPVAVMHHPEDLAYVIYTSGSTGRPKGVMVTHAGLRNYLGWAAPYYGAARGQRAPLHTSVSFDLAVTSLWVPLVSGGTVVICEGVAGAGLAEALRTERTGLLKLTPAHLALLDHGEPHQGAAIAVVGGEALSGAAVQAWRRHAGPEARIYNEYGPTETVVGCSVFDASEWNGGGAVPIGRPIANTQLYVLDRSLEPVPAGVTGELYIGGPGVARGYLGQAALTAACFVPNPFGRGRLYRTGDLARHRDDGNVEYVGRADRQVKIRGHRVELGEIDAILGEHAAVEQVVVVVRGARGATGSDRLVAYVVGRAGQSPDPAALRTHVQQRVPEYMVPATWVVLDALPLTTNGKIDRGRLPDPDAEVVVPREPPRTPIEAELVTIWREVLKVDEVGIHDNFFDLGGHSLIMVTLLSQIRAALNQAVSMTDLFEYPTIGSFAAFVTNHRNGAAAPPRVDDIVAAPDRSRVQALFAARQG